MSVEAPQISIDPYKSQVPLVQIPQQEMTQPQPQEGKIFSKAGGIATIADGAMKGLLRGLQMKEEKKYKTAEAVMNAQDAAIGDAKKRYQDALMTKGKDDRDTQAAWNAYTDVVNKAADARQAFAVPEKTAKQPKGSKKDKTAADGAPAAGGFGAGLKQFFERNPHIVPELAILGMKSQVDPKLYGQMTPEMTAQKTQMDAAQRQESIQKVTDAAVLSRDKYAGKGEAELEKMPASNPTFKNALEEYKNAVEVLTPIGGMGKYQTLVDPQGQQHSVPIGTQIPEGWKLYEKPTAGSTPKIGTEQEYTSQALKGYGYDQNTAPPALLKYLHDTWAYKASQTTSTSGEHMETDPTTGKLVAVKTYGSSTRGAGAPKPPAGFSPVGEDGLPQKGGDKNQSPTPGTGKSGSPLNPYPNPEDQPRDVSLKFNAPWTAPDWQSKVTKLSPADEAEFQKWAAANPKAVEGELDPATADYDVRGHWLAAKKGEPEAVLVPNKWDGKLHGNDKFKLPSNGTFSNESMYATPDAPRWQGNKLVTKDGKIVTDETPKKTGKMTKPPAAPGAGRGSLTAAPLPPGVRDTGIKSMASTKFDVSTEESTRKSYAQIEDTYQRALRDNARNTNLTPEDRKKMDAEALGNKVAAKASLILSRAGQIEAVGGDPWKKRGQYDQAGNEYGTMDGVNWVNVKTGYAYQE